MEVYVLPLSRAQKRLWYQEIINPGNNAYNIPIALRLCGDLNQQALEKVFQTIIARHEVLRTTFAVENGEPIQLVHSEVRFTLESKILESEDELAAESRIPFNLVTGPLIRAILYQVQPQEQILFVNMHHIISDGWSLGVFFQELRWLYNAYVQGHEISLPELPIQYGDYAEWQENWLQEAAIKNQLAYWETTLADLPPALDLPLDHSRPRQQTFNGAMVRAQLPNELYRSLEEVARAEDATFFMVALAVFQVLLFRYSGQTDITVGSPIANRRQSELESLIGFFVNTLPLRGDLSGNPSLRQLLQRIRKTCLDAYTHQDVPFEALVDIVEVKRDPSRSPIFQTLFAVQNAPFNYIQLAGLTVNPIYLDNGGAKFDLTLILEPSTNGWLATLEYNTDLFAPESAQRILKHYCQLLSAAATHPDVWINALPLLDQSDRQELLKIGAVSAPSNHEATNIVELFAKAAETYPKRIAVKFQDQKLTYHELDQRSSRLADFLRQQGVGAEVRVGIFLERSEALIVSLLAVLKAGGTYVPLDPAYPAERLSFILEDSGISLLLTEAALLFSVPTTDRQVITLEVIESALDELGTGSFAENILPSQGAYIIYTSGSTGKPKGCVVTHDNVTRLMRSTESWFGFNQNDVWTLFHSFAFDFSVWEIWGALLYGGKLVVVPYLESRSPAGFRDLLQVEGVTVLNQTPSAFRQLIRADQEVEEKLALRAVIFGGEALELQSLRPWFERYGDQCPRLINMYGITETTVHVTYRPITLADIEQNRGSVIGVPIPDLSLHILDAELQPTPFGVPGEIYIGGMGVSRGYLNRPDLTAQRFIADPFSNKPGARLYRTGDIARRLSQDDIEYLGRSDHQVKVRGFRIELGEIESALVAIPEVSEALVITHSETDTDKRLVAYIVANDKLLERSYLRTVLKQRLPEYMIPAAFVVLDVMPLTAQGKINRKALPAPDWNSSDTKRTVRLPQTPAEKVICQVWETVLGIDAVGVEDNFFELGGDSILAIKVVTDIRRQGWVLTPKDIFRQQTVKELAAVAKQLHLEVAVGEKAVGEAPLSPIQHWFFELNLPNPNHWNQAVFLQVNKSFDPQIIAQAINSVATHHDIFRLRFYQEEGVWRQFYTEDEAAFGFEVVDLTLVDEAQQDAVIKETCESLQRSLDLSHGPLARAALFKGKHPDKLFIVFHHLIIDGVSWRILLEDIAGAMSYISAGKPVLLSPPSSSFKHWSEFLQSFANSSVIQSEKQFWLNLLDEPTSQLPLDFPQAETQNFESSVKTISLCLTEAETNALLTKANTAYHTQPQELLLAALAKTFSNITKDRKIQIIMEGHGREELSSDLDITRTLGWFTTLYPLRLDLSSGTEEQTLIPSVKEQIRAVPRRGLGYGLLRYLQADSATNEMTVPFPADISFNYLGQVRNETGDDKFFTLLNEDTQPSHDPNGLRSHLIDIIGIVVEKELRIDWLYSTNLHREETIANWMSDFRQNLLQILTHCTQPGVGEYTPSDFPLVHLNPSSLLLLQAKYPHLTDIYPLSPLQEGMLFHTLYSPNDGVYFEQVTGKITGELDISAFTIAWHSVVDRHPILRTSFVWEHQELPIQVVSSSVKFALQQEDWSHLSPVQQELQLQQYLAADRQQGFQLDEAPLMRFAIIRLDGISWQWVWSHHHLLLDGWSISVIFKEVLEIYQSHVRGMQHDLSSVIPYRQYIQWLAERNYQEAEEFWQQQLAGISEPTPISWKPVEKIEIQDTTDYGAVELRLSDEEFANVLQMAQNHRLTLNTLAQGAWALLLQKYGAGEDVLFGVTVSGRPPEIAGVEDMVGLFINTLPMRISLSPNTVVTSWLEDIQQRQAQMREYEYSKLTDIRQAIAFPAAESLFESILVFENYPVDQSLKNQGQGIQVDDIQFYERTNYPLTVAFIPHSGLLLKLNYETKLLSSHAAEIMLQRLRNLLLQLAQNPNAPLGNIALLSTEEHNLTVNKWNANSIDWGDFRAAHQLFEDQADLNKDAIALVLGEDSITYGELEQKANTLAATLKSAGVNDESLVGLYFEPSIDFVVALLAVLKAGGAFVPLDTTYPEERLKFILEDNQANFILAKEVVPFKHNYEHSKVIVLSEMEWTHHPKRLNLNINALHLAYVIYTSGSTGKPKGVLVSHAGIQNLVQTQTATFGVTNQSRVYQFASLNFDAAISEIFMALGSGATLYLTSKADRFPGPALWEALTAWKISHLTLVPSVLATIKPEELPELQTLIVAGEAASGNLLRRWGDKERQVFNAYGPTEATVCASMMDCSHLVGEPSIGRGMANTELYLLDPYFQPVAPGIPGEICIGGIGLARGYLNRPGLTASAFIPHPFAKEPGARLYRTGDIGVYDSQGHIYFLGRQDNRVKLHGYRIELGEIEAALAEHPVVESAVVMLREDVPGRQRLVAYVLTPSEEITSQELLNDLSAVLPAYMVPSAVVFVKEWSLTPNGKIDRKALPAPEMPTGQFSTIAINETEKILCQIWTEVLGIEANVNHNFFEIGGDSIMSLQIVSRAREAGLDISPRDVFEAQTLGRLAAIAKPLRQSITVDEALTGKVPLAPIQHWFFERNLPHSHQWNQTVALSVSEPLKMDAFFIALEAIVAHHDAFRLGFDQNQGIWEQSYTAAASPPLRIKDFSSYPPNEQRNALDAVVAEEQELIDLKSPPLLRVLYAKNLEEYGDVLIFFGHHLIVDGVSWRIIFEDLNQAYCQAAMGKPVSLPARSSSYRQWTTSLEKLGSSPEIVQDLSFWQETLAHKSAALPLDSLTSGESNTVASLVVETSQLSSGETLSLLKEAIATYHAGVQEILLAALLKTLTDWSNSSHILIDLEGHGREDLGSGLDISRTVGWFTSLYPVLLQKPQENENLENLLKEVKKQLRAIPNHGISFGLLRYLNHNPDTRETLTHLDKPQISFNYLGQVDNQQNSNNIFSLSNVPTGSGMFAKQERPHILAINARVQGECLWVDWSYSKHLHNAQTIRHLAENYLHNLRAYLTNPIQDKASFYTTSDFHLVELTDNELDSLLEDLG
jgi:amino acid adenylation domain-containing protein/non-ribosomal peptide synthase protein (TIGR01720 family)